MVTTKTRKVTRQASSSRLTVLLLFLIVVGAGCVYEFAFARPGYQKAWEEIRKVDESKNSSEYTSDQIREKMDREPYRVDDSLHEQCVVHTYRWRSGLLVKSHDIHVVFTKLNDTLLEKRPDLKGNLYYYSASAGQPLDLDANFPQEKQTIVENLNPPMIAVGGGGGGGGNPGQGRRGDGNRRNAADDQKNGEASSEDSGTDDQDQAAPQTSPENAAKDGQPAKEGEATKGEATKEGEAPGKADSAPKKEGTTEKGESSGDGQKKSGDEKSDKKSDKKSDG